ncbi:unnamed protein product [Lactuca saligna]|uniref:Uncharacterized protein n=1 Tax=Lactuca saligna TaxID=75948 RepID=A0AA35YUY7_LACSI|nr:unnamed protein product [Lactuca saligna]
MDSHLDLPITLKAFQFRNFDKNTNASLSNHDVDEVLFLFYFKHMKPQYQIWRSTKITTVMVVGLIETESFLNARCKTARGDVSLVFEFTLADLSCLNPYDWISMLHLLLKDEQKYEPIMAHLKRMLVSYIHKVSKMDVEIAAVL